MKTLVAGPWVGEFGWELFRWQAFVRTVAKKFDNVICISRPGNALIYKDFANEFIEYDPVDDGFGSPPDGGKLKGFTRPRELNEYIKAGSLYLPGRGFGKPMLPFNKPVGIGNFGPVVPSYVPLGEGATKKVVDIVIHPRNRPLNRAHNWSVHNWTQVIKAAKGWGLKVGVIGTERESFPLKGVMDLRGIPIEETAPILRKAKCILGGSSGGMHLATLCKCPQIVWGLSHNKPRYERWWNPFNTRVVFLPSVSPRPEAVIMKLKQFI